MLSEPVGELRIDLPTDPKHAERVWSRLRERFAKNGSKSGVGYAEALIDKDKIERSPWSLSPIA